MNINGLRPRVFWHGEMWQVREIDFTSKSLWIENSRRHSVIYEDYENIKIDRPVGMIKDIHGKWVMLYENDMLRVHTYENHKIANHLPDSLIIWRRDLLLRFDAIADGDDMDIDEHSNLSYYLDNDDIFGLEIIGNVHENPDLAPEWWKHKNANS